MMHENELRRQFARLREADQERAPTDVFLPTPGGELLGAMPALGASVLDTMIPLPSKGA